MCGLFLPTQLRYNIGNAAPRTKVGIFVGVRQHMGATWSGESVVLDIGVVVDQPLSVDHQASWGNTNHYVTKRVDSVKP